MSQYGTPHAAERQACARGRAPLAGQLVELQGRPYPYKGAFRKMATATTRADGTLRLRARASTATWTCGRWRPPRAGSSEVAARLRLSRARARRSRRSRGSRLRITQFLRTPPNVQPDGAGRPSTSARRTPSSRPPLSPAPSRARIGRGRFKATATVKLPRAWKGALPLRRAASATPRAAGWAPPARSARSATASERRARAAIRRSRAPARRSPAAR